MTATSGSQVRSASILETVPGTTPATPAFATRHGIANLMAVPSTFHGRSLVSKGARMGAGLNAIPVAGSFSGTMPYGVYDNDLATLLQSTWVSNVLKDGKAETAMTVENAFPAGVGGTLTMLRFRGVEAVAGKLMIEAQKEAMLSFDYIGRGSDPTATTIITGATYTDPTEADPLSSGIDVGTITMGGFTLDCIQSLEIDFAFENREAQPRISSNDLCGVTRGDFLPKITANMMIEGNFAAFYNGARAAKQTPFTLTIPLGSVTTKKYTIVFHSCVLGDVEPDLSGATLFQKIPIIPLFNVAQQAVVTITRAVV